MRSFSKCARAAPIDRPRRPSTLERNGPPRETRTAVWRPLVARAGCSQTEGLEGDQILNQ